MVKVGLLVRLEAKPGKEQEVEEFIQAGLALVEEEPKTVNWYGIKIGATTYGIFDTFNDDSGKEAHLTGKVAKALFEKAPDLFKEPPHVEAVDILAAK
ncbi:MAG: antibiotic biosynthesis monooxygenase [Proteobacteria bacterium]|nr:antibiotic biosynthesis monooxygenase [Pseudomonadota bacterium]